MIEGHRLTAAFQKAKYLVIDKMCYAEFLRYHYLKNNIKLSDSQLEVLKNELVESTHPPPKPCYLPEILMMSFKEKLNCCKVLFALRYLSLKKLIHLEKYSHHLLFLLGPFVINAPFLSSLKKLENCKVFCCFQGV